MSKLLSCDDSGVCVVNGMPIINQEDPRIAQSTYGLNQTADCYDTSICSLVLATLANRDASMVPAGRTLAFSIIPASNGIPKELNQLAWQQKTAGTAKSYYFSEVLADFGPLYQAAPDPRIYSGKSKVLYTSDHGANFRDWTSIDTSHITNEYIAELLNNDFAVMVGFRWTKPQVDELGQVTLNPSGEHKLVFSGCRKGAYPLRVNDIFNEQQQWTRLVRFDQATRPFGQPGATGKDISPASRATLNSNLYLEFDNHTTPTDDVCVVTQIDAISLNWRPPQRTLNWHWATGWTRFAPFTMAGSPYFLAYNATTGETQLDKVVDNGCVMSWRGSLPGGFTQMMPFTLQQKPYCLAYNTLTGAVQFIRIKDNLQGIEIAWSGSWGKGFTHFTPFEVDGVAHFIAYNAHTGLVHIDRINANLMGSFTRFEASWAPGFTTLMPFTLEGSAHFIAYMAATGEVHFDRISRQGLLGGQKPGNDLFLDIRGKLTWGTGWSHFTPIAWNGLAHFFAYNNQTGELHFDRVEQGGTGSESLWMGKTSTGFTTTSSFVLNGRPYILLYNQTSGEVAYFSATPL